MTNLLDGIDPNLSEAIDQRIRQGIRRGIRLFVLPAFVISGLGISTAMWLEYHDDYQVCVQRVDFRTDFRKWGRAQLDQMDDLLGLGSSDSPELREARAIAAETRRNFERDFVALDAEDC